MDNKLAVIMASMMPFETLVRQLKSTIDDYEANPTEDNKDSVAATASMILMNQIAGGSVEGAIKIADRFGKMERLEQLFETGEN